MSTWKKKKPQSGPHTLHINEFTMGYRQIKTINYKAFSLTFGFITHFYLLFEFGKEKPFFSLCGYPIVQALNRLFIQQ